MATQISLRPVILADLPTLFTHQIDPEAVRMAAFPPRDHDAFMAHWQKILADPQLYARAILVDGVVAGNIGSWTSGSERMVGYWVGREFWGQGVATAALTQFIREIPDRPLVAHVVKHNAGSIRVLRKCGFMETGKEAFVGADGRPEEELIFKLDEPKAYASPACSMPAIED
jgi:RimJ/RimL family protein N-acetyltransferase